ncbi:MAG: hypothetical protein OXL37_02110 [Chloroflexota bacterium]|nr:hypothetical protein [Chloroflexota bacterium]MDE2961479.1 hypothetical protein [Chloroflexota bacterium]
MQPQLELNVGLTATCCTALQYLEGAAYIAIVLAVFGVPQLLTYYLDRRDRRRDRREERAEAERVRQEERAEAERRHHEMMTALIAILDRNGHSAPPDQSTAIERLQQRIAELEAEIALLRNGNEAGSQD